MSRKPMKPKERLDLYRHALSEICKQNGGEIFVRMGDLEAGTLMNRLEEDGVRFRYVPDGTKS